ncbi:MAG: Nif3-like dinuclear metal center protein, partial [Coxiella sp. (in: Bacteria)]
MQRQELMAYLTDLLTPERYHDYCPNGLQVSGTPDIKRIISGVSANQALISAAIEQQADLLLVHHGYFWKGEDPCLIDLKYDRIKLLMQHNINLVVYHLPLDGHHELGNNAQLARVLGLTVQSQLSSGETPALTWQGLLEPSMSGDEFAAHIDKQLDRTPFYV